MYVYMYKCMYRCMCVCICMYLLLKLSPVFWTLFYIRRKELRIGHKEGCAA